MLASLLVFGARFRVWCALLLTVVTVGLGAGLPYLHLDTSVELLFGANSPETRRYDEVAAEFGSDVTAVIHLRDPALFSPHKLARLETLVRVLEADTTVERVDSIFSVSNLRHQGGSLVVEPIIDTAPADAAGAARIREAALYSPLVRGQLVSADGQAMVVLVHWVRTSAEDDAQRHARVDELLAPLRGEFALVSQVGAVRTHLALRDGVLADVARMAPLTVVAIMAIVWLMLRRPRLALLPLATGVLSVVWTFGFMGWMGIAVTMLMPILFSLLVCVSATEDIHIIAGYLEAQDSGDGALPPEAALRLAGRHLSAAVLVSILTTVAGFFSNLGADLRLMSEFALVAGVGILFNGVITILGLPMALSLLAPAGAARAPSAPRTAPQPNLSQRLADHLSRRIIEPAMRHERKVLAVATVVLTAFALLALDTRVNSDPLSFFRADAPVVRDNLAVSQDMAGVQSFYITLDGGRPDFFLEPAHLRLLEEVKQAVEGEGFDRAMSLADSLALLNREMHGGDPAQHTLPASRELVEQYLLFFQRSEIARYVSADFRSANLVVRHKLYNSEAVTARLDRVIRRLEGKIPATVRMDFVGKSLLVYRAGQRLVVSEAESLVWALAFIVAILGLMFASVRIGLLVVLANLAPIILAYGVMRLFGAQLNPGTVMVAAIAIGIAVDDTTHLLVRYSHALRQNPDNEHLVRDVLRAEAAPVLTSALALSAGFAIALFSSFASTAQFGAMACLCMLFGVLTELVLTPIMLKRVHAVMRTRVQDAAAPAPARAAGLSEAPAP